MNKRELQKILDAHQKWVQGKKEGMGANLREADLWEADLSGANLWGANLWGANLPPPTMLLLCHWGKVSNKLTIELMHYDASNHPDPKKFDAWANGGQCPYERGFSRSANFQEQKELWKPGRAKSALELILMLFEEKNIKFKDNDAN